MKMHDVLKVAELQASNDKKISKIAAGYTKDAEAAQSCMNCSYFGGKDTCSLVGGAIDPSSTCKHQD